ncbi:MAG: PAS domain-containing methyl-accepting chemotaxis protein [Thiohalomonadales bacterium]
MKKNLPITDTENVVKDQTMVTTTNAKGIITYCNQEFIDISGFSSEELLNKNHNVVRHPDMPPEAFDDLWNTLKRNEPWMGMVKNRCKNGDYYWVEAFVEPVTENAKTIGYVSTRVKPETEPKQRAEKLYKQILAGKNIFSGKFKPQLPAKITSIFSVIQFGLLSGLVYFEQMRLNIALGSFVAGIIFLYLITRFMLRTLKRAAQESRAVVDNNLMQQIFVGNTDDVSQLQLAIRLLQSRIRTIVRRLEQSSSQLSQQALDSKTVIEKTSAAVSQQQMETEQIATAINEMASTVTEVVNNTEKAAEASEMASKSARSGAVTVSAAIGIIDSLANDIETTETVIQQLSDDSENIGSVLAVIKSIAEQTNLLALNAAIEAARAGEQGRGFAVVADEVRTLANRSQSSAGEINLIIEKLQAGASNAVRHMKHVRSRAQEGVDQVELSAEALAQMSGEVDTINLMNTQIASAAEEQRAVTEEINRNIHNISESAIESTAGSDFARCSNEKLISLVHDLDLLVNQFQHSR